MAELPTKEEIARKALELYYKEHPEAIEHGLTPDVEKELRPPEGYYYRKAQIELMGGIKEELLKALSAYRDEIEKITQTLKELGEKPEWPPPPPEELESKITELENKIADLERKKLQAEKQAEELAAKLEETRKILAEKERQLQEKKEIEKKYIFKMVTVKFLKPTEAFIGADGKIYGSFSQGEIASLPEQNAYTLIKEGAAQLWTITKPAKPLTPEEKREQIRELCRKLKRAIIEDELSAAKEFLKQIRELRS